MDHILLGQTGLRVSRLGFGCSQIASLSSRHSPGEVMATLEEAVEHGINFFDTANVYGQGDSETMLGRLAHGRRDQLIICTKAGLHVGLKQSVVRLVKPILQPIVRHFAGARRNVAVQRMKAQKQCFDVTYLEKQIHASLRRLRSDYVDVFLLHSPAAAVVPGEEMVAFLTRLVRNGVARHVGISCAVPSDVSKWLEALPHAVYQLQVSFWMPEALTGILPKAHSAGAGIVLREVLGRVPHQQSDQWIDRKQLAELAIRYLADRAQPEIILCGMSCREHLRANLQAFRRESLTASEMVILQQTQQKSQND